MMFNIKNLGYDKSLFINKVNLTSQELVMYVSIYTLRCCDKIRTHVDIDRVREKEV